MSASKFVPKARAVKKKATSVDSLSKTAEGELSNKKSSYESSCESKSEDGSDQSESECSSRGEQGSQHSTAEGSTSSEEIDERCSCPFVSF